MTPHRKDLSYLADYAYSEVPPDQSPAVIVLQSLADIPVGTPVDEIKLASEAFGLDFTFMKAVARIESDFDPKQRTGSYIGLFQLSNYEFARYGSGDITSPRDNAVAAAYKFATAAALFEMDTTIKPTLFDLYLIHQQGWQGAAEHISHPERIAWQSMCATDEGHDKGEKWCKRAIWQNTLPDIKRIYKSVENLTLGRLHRHVAPAAGDVLFALFGDGFREMNFWHTRCRLAKQEAAVHGQRCPGGVGGAIRTEKQHRFGDLFGSADAAKRDIRHDGCG